MTQTLSPNAVTAIAISADHGGYNLKSYILANSAAHLIDLGTRNDSERVDVQDYTMAVVKAIYDRYVARGIVICKTGHMASIVANRFPFIRAALCHTPEQAVAARAHNDANVLCLPAAFIDDATALAIVDKFLTTDMATDERYAMRLERLAALDPTQFDKEI